MEMSYLRDGCGVSRVNSESNDWVYGKFVTSSTGKRNELVEMVKGSTLRLFGQLEKMGESEMMRRICHTRLGWLLLV